MGYVLAVVVAGLSSCASNVCIIRDDYFLPWPIDPAEAVLSSF